MARVAGITTQKNTKGEITHVTINVKKHREAFGQILEEMGVLEKSDLQKKMESQKWHTREEAEVEIFKKLDKLWQK